MSAAKRPVEGDVRLQKAHREQLELVPTNIDDLIALDHLARCIWKVVVTLDPAILVTLWIFATSQGVGSAREPARLTREHAAYRWIRGQVEVSCHTLSDFRVDHGKALDDLMAQILAVLMRQDLVTLERTTQDGLKVRASAGGYSAWSVLAYDLMRFFRLTT